MPSERAPRDPTPRASEPFALGLGQRTRAVAGVRRRNIGPLTRSELAEQIRLAQHALCAEHVEVPGLTEPVCILTGQDRDEVLRSVLELLEPSR